MPTVTTLCEETGISYRQANHWISKGYIPEVTPEGTGYPLSLSGFQVDIFKAMAALVQLGFEPKRAADIALLYARNDSYFEAVTPTFTVVIDGKRKDQE